MINDQSVLGTEQTALIKFITLDEREFWLILNIRMHRIKQIAQIPSLMKQSLIY